MHAWDFEKIWPSFGILSIFADRNFRKNTPTIENKLTATIGHMYAPIKDREGTPWAKVQFVVIPRAGMRIEIIAGAICRLLLERCLDVTLQESSM